MRKRSLDVAERLRVLPQLGTEALRALWIELYGRPPRFRARKELMVPMLAYRLQEIAQGGLSSSTRKRLRAFADRIDTKEPRSSRPDARPKAGTRLIREWNGHTHVVSVLDNGVEYRGKRYGSLSEVARVITGTRWSGPAFFGLKSTFVPRGAWSRVRVERKRLRCAIYTRKSSEEGLEQSFNSLEAQREACVAYVQSQRHEGWRGLEARYDDGGYSGGSMARPALQRLLADIDAGKVDVVVVYKVDRLTRSLADFAKMVERFDGRGVSFVSVTQQFNTAGSMGRLTLNVLLSFAQFEREVTGERIRDKIAASKKKGMWMGGVVPLGYEAEDRKLVVNPPEAAIVRTIFEQYLALGCVRKLEVALKAKGSPASAV